MLKIRQHIPFFSSVFVGILVWLFVFMLFPAKPVYPFSLEALLYITFSYLALVIGYTLVPSKQYKTKDYAKIWSTKRIYVLIFIIIVSFLVRYIDLFYVRGVSFDYDVWQNRDLLNKTKPGFFLIFFSICKQLYFIPLILLLKEKVNDKRLLTLSVILFLIPFIEGVIRGSRNSFFIPVILLLFIFIYFKKIHFKKKQLLTIVSIGIVLFFIATSIIIAREKPRTDENYSSITTDFLLNDFLKPQPEVFETIQKTKNETIKELMISGFQVGQYYVHGVFEFDYLMRYYQRKPLHPQYGKYMFATVNRFTNKCGLTETNLDLVQAKHPRGYTFITFFGGLYIDFGWLGILIMFVYGASQKVIVNAIRGKKIEYIPLFIFLLFVNFFMLTFNFIENTGTYFLVVCLGFILYVRVFGRIQVFLNNRRRKKV